MDVAMRGGRRSQAASGSRRVIYAGIAGNVLVTITKFAAAAVTHSAAMLSEAVHSLVDTFNDALMLYGLKRAERPPTKDNPLGHGREVYFWAFVVSVLIFLLGAGVSIWQGIEHVLDPPEIDRPLVSYVVLGLAAVFEGGSWWIAMREFRRRKGEKGYVEAAQATKDPSTLLLLLEDSAALVGIAIAFTGIFLAQLLDEPRFDGAASIAIGVVLAGVALFLARESKKLLIGEAAHTDLRASVRELADDQDGVSKCNGMLTFQLGPDTVAIALSAVFEAELKAREIERVVEKLEERIRAKHPEVVLLVVKPQSTRAWNAARRRLGLR
ncbi:MAG TPA: cation diffusion facilitator family transporter [Usitatibacter sp.]|jgi:cation diffusion facilitator family transporter|nr:cation diffusion facilitator family transporter [Usitatibacter sp.]